ncbi:hypothetical protein HS3_00539 [Bacillus subtilis]|nr:hypothetical protein HS3_00539 [Bacillus subtilis]
MILIKDGDTCYSEICALVGVHFLFERRDTGKLAGKWRL